MINALPVRVEFVVVTGDVFSDSIRRDDVREEGLAAMKDLKAPVYYVPGNHDLLQSDRTRTAGLFEKHLGPLNRKTEIRGVTCLFLCTEMEEGETRSPGAVEREWVEEALGEGQAGQAALLFMHRPPVRDLLNGSDGAVSWDDPYDTRWADVFSRHPEIKAVFAGHFHRDVMCWIGAVPVYVAPAVARFWDRQPAFRLYQYKGGRINYWTLYPERPKTRGGR
jgi:3',5'-cyclic AMP phosphodiesterase CpdA